MIVLQILILLFWLVIIPFCMGLLPIRLLPARHRSVGAVFLAGYITFFAVFEVVAIPIVMTTIYHGFTIMKNWFMIISLILSALGAVWAVYSARTDKGWRTGWRDGYSQGAGFKAAGLEEKLIWLLFIGLLFFQLYMLFTRASFDGDDAYYVVHSLTAQQQDVLYRIEPYTGKSTPLDARHALAVFPLWIAFLAGTSGIHATVVSHTLVPMLLLPLTYLVYFQIGRSLLKDKPGMQPVFMVVLALFQMFGNVSIYTNETFLMTRTWQGKSFVGNFVIPMVIWLFLLLLEDLTRTGQAGLWVLLFLTNAMAGVGSSLAMFLCAMLTAILGFFMMIRTRKFSVLVKAGLTCIPNGIYILLYMFLHI